MAENTSHDQNFKNLILDYPKQALEFFAAVEAAQLEQATITPIRQEQLKGNLSHSFRELDVPLLVEWPDGKREALIFALEEETHPRHFSIHRLAHYCLDLSRLFDINHIVPVVIFLNPVKGVPKALTLGGNHHTYLHFHYLACSLAELDYLQWHKSHNIVARLNLPNMRYSRAQKLEVYAQAIRGLIQLEPNIYQQMKYADFIDIYTHLTDNEQKTFRQQYRKEEHTMMSWSAGQTTF